MKRAICFLAIAGLAFGLPGVTQAQVADGTTTGWVTSTATFFDYSKGFGADLTQVLEKYDYRQGLGGDRRTGFLVDITDLRLSRWAGGRQQWLVERQSSSYDNHRGSARFDTDGIRLSAGYGFLRTAASGVNFLYSPNRVQGGTDPGYSGGTVGFFRTFSDDTGETVYRVARTRLGVDATLKPALLGDLGTLTVGYQRTSRSGNRFSPYVLGGGDVQGDADARAQLRWRAYDREVDEAADRGSVRLNLSPRGILNLDYQLSVDRFETKTLEYTLSNTTSGIGFGVNPPSFSAGRETLPLNFIPSSTLLTHRLGATKRVGRTAVISGGYAKSVLDQDGFTNRENAAGFEKGRISTDAAFLAASARVVPRFGIEGRYGYSSRSNDSQFPVAGFYDPSTNFTAPRLDEMKRTNLRLEGTFYPNMARASVALGWARESTDRDLTYGIGRGVPAQRSLYGEESQVSNYYLRLAMRPLKGVNLRLRAARYSGDKVGVITDAESGTDVNLSLGYTAPSGVVLNGFFGLRDRSNDGMAFTGGPEPATAKAQKRDAAFKSAGFLTSYAPSERAALTLNYTWAQTDVGTNFFTTNIRRFDQATNVTAIVFTLREAQQTTFATHTLSLGGDVQAADKLTLGASYLLTAVRGDAASGTAGAALPSPDQLLDNTLSGLALSADYRLQGSWLVRGSYYFDYYKDAAFSQLTGGRNTLGLSVVRSF